jgi:NADPH:quinone reductase-like Zn-dependent oxidoreductase
MKAILVKKHGSPENLYVDEIERPEVKKGQVLIRIKAFGINRAELYMRKGAWPEIAPVIGIECVGLVEEDPSGTFENGQKVVAFMGGLGRTINGSYAEYTAASLSNVVAVHTGLDWASLAAIPETFASAWGALHWGLQVKEGQTLLIRAATSAFGQAALVLAKQMGMHVIVTTRTAVKADLLRKLGADEVFIENGQLAETLLQEIPDGVDRVLDLVGNTVLRDSIQATKVGGIVCQAGFLGGMDPVLFNPIADMRSGVYLTFIGSFNFGSREFPVSDIPMQKIIEDIEMKRLPSIHAETYPFEKIADAHRRMESNAVNGKIVVVV